MHTWARNATDRAREGRHTAARETDARALTTVCEPAWARTQHASACTRRGEGGQVCKGVVHSKQAWAQPSASITRTSQPARARDQTHCLTKTTGGNEVSGEGEGEDVHRGGNSCAASQGRLRGGGGEGTRGGCTVHTQTNNTFLVYGATSGAREERRGDGIHRSVGKGGACHRSHKVVCHTAGSRTRGRRREAQSHTLTGRAGKRAAYRQRGNTERAHMDKRRAGAGV